MEQASIIIETCQVRLVIRDTFQSIDIAAVPTGEVSG
jgi:hypothetical protein